MLAPIAAGFVVGIYLAFWLSSWTWGRRKRAETMRPVPQEPCRTEEIPSDRRSAYGRAQCVNDELMAADARMRREASEGAGG
jgi:uncharacterized protein VirK/YbjX